MIQIPQFIEAVQVAARLNQGDDLRVTLFHQSGSVAVAEVPGELTEHLNWKKIIPAAINGVPIQDYTDFQITPLAKPTGVLFLQKGGKSWSWRNDLTFPQARDLANANHLTAIRLPEEPK